MQLFLKINDLNCISIQQMLILYAIYLADGDVISNTALSVVAANASARIFALAL